MDVMLRASFAGVLFVILALNASLNDPLSAVAPGPGSILFERAAPSEIPTSGGPILVVRASSLVASADARLRWFDAKGGAKEWCAFLQTERVNPKPLRVVPCNRKVAPPIVRGAFVAAVRVPATAAGTAVFRSRTSATAARALVLPSRLPGAICALASPPTRSGATDLLVGSQWTTGEPHELETCGTARAGFHRVLEGNGTVRTYVFVPSRDDLLELCAALPLYPDCVPGVRAGVTRQST